MTADELKEVLVLHRKWLRGEEGGKRANLEGADLEGANLRTADLRSANLRTADLEGADLEGADLRSADLRSANLRSADLEGADLRSADLRSANLRSADLEGADLEGANLEGANLRSANLRSANLEGANLEGANLRSADLEGANLEGANLRSADLAFGGGPLPIEPIPDLRAKVMAAVERDGCSLDMSQWHKCETTHCLAGWITTLHPQGKLLESLLSPSTAAALILSACGETVPDFYDMSDGAEARALNWLRTGVQADPDPITPTTEE
jgi:hypothetical protein